jgi:hypothetical protein
MQQRELMVLYKNMAATRIANFFAMLTTRKAAMRFILAGRRITKGGRQYLSSRYHRKVVTARKHYRRASMRSIFRALLRFQRESYEDLLARAEKLYPKLAARLRKKTFKDMQSKELQLIDKRLTEASEVLWETSIKLKLMAAWKSIRGQERSRKQNLVSIFLACVDIDTYNSSRHRAKAALSKHFMRQKLLFVAYLGFADDYARSIKVNTLYHLT